jgi:hypothetical protein
VRDEDDDNGPMIWLIGAGLALVVAVVVTMVALWPSGDEPSSAAPAADDWRTARLRPSDSPAPAPVASTPSSATPSAGRSTPPPSTSARALPSVPAGAQPSAPAPGAPAPPALPEPPAADRTGVVSGCDGCLDVTAGSIIIGNGLAVRLCDRTSSQRWTLAADGTFRSVGLCARSEGDGVVKLQDCGSGGANQWRAGANGSLVNADVRQCLTRTGGGAVRLAGCGAQGQDWALP